MAISDRKDRFMRMYLLQERITKRYQLDLNSIVSFDTGPHRFGSCLSKRLGEDLVRETEGKDTSNAVNPSDPDILLWRECYQPFFAGKMDYSQDEWEQITKISR